MSSTPCRSALRSAANDAPVMSPVVVNDGETAVTAPSMTAAVSKLAAGVYCTCSEPAGWPSVALWLTAVLQTGSGSWSTPPSRLQSPFPLCCQPSAPVENALPPWGYKVSACAGPAIASAPARARTVVATASDSNA